MIQIGHRIWIVDYFPNGEKNPTPYSTMVYFDGKPVGAIQNISIDYNCTLAYPTKNCSIYMLNLDNDIRMEAFISELAIHGFTVKARDEKKIITTNYDFVAKKLITQEERT